MHYRSAAASTRIVASPYRSTRSVMGVGDISRRIKRRRPIKKEYWMMSLAVGATVFLTISTCLAFLKFFEYLTSTRSGTTLQVEGDWDGEDEILPWNPLYRVPSSIESVGDRSDEYARLRMKYDFQYPQDPTRSLQAAAVIQSRSYASDLTVAAMDTHHSDQVPYDIYDCPDTPPAGYPFAWNVMTVLNNWQPDDTTPPASNQIYQGLCVFDYQTDYEKAVTYRDAELPFVVINDPNVAATAERWNHPGYMEEMLGDVPHRTEYSENNHFLYHLPVSKKHLLNKKHRLKVPKDYKPPTKLLRMPYKLWLQNANVTDDKLGPNDPHWYYRLIGCGATGRDGSCDKGSSEYLFDEMPFFQPKKSLYIADPKAQQGIHCRFGMKGVIAENHFDSNRNAIALLGGSRRYILTHPDQCEKLALYPKGHPSARHSAVDWSEPDLSKFPEFADAKVNEVVLSAGQVLYLPDEYFHYIISLELNYQCNTRSGITGQYKEHIQRCGFP